MRTACLLLAVLSAAITLHAQDSQSPTLNIGDPAPPLQVREWLKGKPVQQFEKGKVYVVEFWATWCAPCRAMIPHVSDMAREYKNRVTFIGMDVLEQKAIKPKSIEKIRKFVDSMGNRMDYAVAAEKSNLMATKWLNASGGWGIPVTFVVDADSRLAWMGYPTQLKEVLPKILNNTWSTQQAHKKRTEDLYLAALDDSLNWEFFNYKEDRSGLHRWTGHPDSALMLVKKIVSKEPRLKYATHMAINTLEALLKTNLHEAYEYAKALMATPNYNVVYNTIDYYKDQLNLPAEMCELGAKACQQRIEQSVLPEYENLSYYYNKMAGLYWSAKNKSKAIESAQKAIEVLKEGKFYSRDLAVYKSRLQEYTNR